MLQARLDEISKTYPFKKIEYVYSGGQIKSVISVIIDVEDFLLEIESNPDLIQSFENNAKTLQKDHLLNKGAAEMNMAEKREFALSLKGKYKNCNTDSKRFAEAKRQEIELEEEKFKRK